ncbi:MAG: ComF family protein [Bacteroidaceae bacterium]|nr:ComF family protein [Bacteroidaceae bacterium]
MQIGHYVGAVLDILFPRRCWLCARTLGRNEDRVCTVCHTGLPLARLDAMADNAVTRLFYDVRGTCRATAYLAYRYDNAAYRLIHRLKYGNRPAIGEYIGERMGYALLQTPFFDGIDMLIPVPLSKEKKRLRGFNQSDYLAKGLSRVTGIPMRTDIVQRVVNNPTQTNLDAQQRRANVEGIFAVNAEWAKQYKQAGHKPLHILLIDDVITTGATLHSLAATLSEVGDMQLSYLGAALAGRHLNVFEQGAE